MLSTTESLATTIHGPGIGLDETECLKAQVLGLASAIRRSKQALALKRIIIIERDADTAETLVEALDDFCREQPELIVKQGNLYQLTTPPSSNKVDQLRIAALQEPSIFVAMPFSKEFRNIYDYGIRLPIRSASPFAARR